jgi:hypothetical protein
MAAAKIRAIASLRKQKSTFLPAMARPLKVPGFKIQHSGYPCAAFRQPFLLFHLPKLAAEATIAATWWQPTQWS